MLQRIDTLFKSTGLRGAVLISGFANIFYYSGFTSEDAFLLITAEERYIITDSRYFIQAKLECPDFELIDIKKGWEYVFSLTQSEQIYFEEDSLNYGTYLKLSEKAQGKEFVPAQTRINLPRQRKDKRELEIIKEAEKIGDDAFSYVLNKIHPGIREKELAFELEMHMKKSGASGLAFDTIIASGVRSAMPHGAASDKEIKNGDLVTLDFGCRYKGYCSDMTRTVVIGKPEPKQREVYDIVLKAQTEAIKAIKLGVSCADIDKVARDIITEAGYGDNFGHSLGHSVGAEIHEMPVFSPKSTDILHNGNVLSVEPGIYIDGWGGVRIEDLMAVFDGEIINLTASPKELIEL